MKQQLSFETGLSVAEIGSLRINAALSVPDPSLPFVGHFQHRAVPRNLGSDPRVPTTIKEKLTKIGAKVVRHGRYVAIPMAEVAIPRGCSPTSCGSSRSCDRRPWRPR